MFMILGCYKYMIRLLQGRNLEFTNHSQMRLCAAILDKIFLDTIIKHTRCARAMIFTENFLLKLLRPLVDE